MANMITGTVTATLENATMGQRASHTSYIRAAEGFLRATEILAADARPPTGPLGLMAAHCLEVTLKAYLLYTGMKEDDFLPRNRGIGHSLADAWNLCVTKGLPIENVLPLWVGHLNSGHDRPFMFRYINDNTGIVLPPKADLVSGVRGVLEQVKAIIKES